MKNLKDLEICKRIADIDGVSWIQVYPDSNDEFVGIIDDGGFPEVVARYDPLEKSPQGKALCVDLMDKYEIGLTPMVGGFWRADFVDPYNYKGSVSCSMCASCTDRDFQRAICLVLIYSMCMREKKQ